MQTKMQLNVIELNEHVCREETCEINAIGNLSCLDKCQISKY